MQSVGEGRREEFNTTEQGAREEEEEEEKEGGGGVGGWMPDHSITFLLHFYSGIGKESQKKGVQKGRDKVIVSQLPVKKRRISWRI